MNRKKILLVDDDEMTRMLLRESLSKIGNVEIYEAVEGSQALDMFHSTEFALILLDVDLPRLSGFEVCKFIRDSDSGRDIPIVMITGMDDNDSIEHAYELGATDFIVKPINWSLIVHHIRYVLRSSASVVALRESERRLDHAQQMACIGYWELDSKSNKFKLSQQLANMLSLPGTRFEHGLDYLVHLAHPVERLHLKVLLKRALEDGENFELDIRVTTPDKTIMYIHIQGQVLQEQSHILVGTMQDVSNLKKSQEQLTHLAHHDALTNLPNRILFQKLLDGAIHRSQRFNRKVALLFIDLDRFKNINDSLGHETGDKLLIKVAERLRMATRTYDTVARLGGDEFAILLDAVVHKQDVMQLTERVLDSFHEPVTIQDNTLYIEASIGISLYPDNGVTQEELLRNADTAMYQAKRSKQDKTAFYSSDLTEETMKIWILENELREALEQENFYLLYQPKVNPMSNKIEGVEALIRWDRGERGFVSPAEFIPIAQDTGLIVPLGRWVIAQAIDQIARWKGTVCENLSIAVNVSVGQLHTEGLSNYIASELHKKQVNPDLLEIEITEEYLIEENYPGSRCQETLRSIHELGIKMAIDDFGTGYSSLAQIRNLPISTLKIDKTFVDFVPENKKNVAIVLSIISFAKNLGLQVVAEGVESHEQATFIRNSGCDLIQGYVYSKPVPAKEIEEKVLATLEQKTA